MILQFLLFLLSFLISFGFLEKTKIFSRTVNIIVSIVIAFYVLFASTYYAEEIILIVGFLFLFILIIFILALIHLARKK
jgi:hypothetical protein